MWVTAILLINEVPDRKADARAGKRTLVVRFGTEGTRWIYLALHVTACAAFLLAGSLRLVPWWMGAASLVLMAGAGTAARNIREPIDRALITRSIEMTLRLQTGGGLLLLAAVLLAALL
jgi:1,4-dihydroxy-2-naphthoate octaprenyltransferase